MWLVAIILYSTVLGAGIGRGGKKMHHHPDYKALAASRGGGGERWVDSHHQRGHQCSVTRSNEVLWEHRKKGRTLPLGAEHQGNFSKELILYS